MEKFNLDEGKWRTIGGRRVFIREGESLSSAMKNSGKFKSAKKKSEFKNENKKFSNDELNEKYVERKKQMENWLDETNSGKLSKHEEEALKYEREKHGEKAYQDLKKEFEKGDDTFRKASAFDSNDKEEEKKKIGGWRINEQGKKEYYERELADNERGYWTKENGQRVFKENPNYKGDKKELNLSQRQKDEGNRLNSKAENGAREDVKTFLSGKEDYDGSQEDFIRDLSNEWGISKEKAEEILHDENIKHPRNFTNNQQKSIEKNMPEGAKFSKMLEESNVKTFADEIKEQNKIETISKAEYDKMPNDYKGTLKELVETAEFRGENKQDLIKQYEKMGFDVDKDKTILANEKGGTVLKPVKISDESEFYKKLSNKDKEKYNNYLKEGYTKNDIENTLMYKTQEDLMRDSKIKFASDEETKQLQSKANEVAKGLKETTPKNNEKYSVDYFKQRGVEIKDSVPEGYIKLEGATTAPNGYEWYSNGKSRFGGEYKNALVKKENTSSSINNTIRRKAYQKYLKEHPASKITFEDFKDMKKMQ